MISSQNEPTTVSRSQSVHLIGMNSADGGNDENRQTAMWGNRPESLVIPPSLQTDGIAEHLSVSEEDRDIALQVCEGAEIKNGPSQPHVSVEAHN